MMKENENWEANLDWSGFDPIGGMPFYLFVRDTCMAVLEKSIGALVKMRDERAGKIERWGEISRSATRLDEAFAKFDEAVDGDRMIECIDTKIELECPTASMSISKWLRFGRSLTSAFRNGSQVPKELKNDLAATERDLNAAQKLHGFFNLYLKVAKRDFMLRNAPDKFKTRQFRLFACEVKSLIEAGRPLDCENGPDFIKTFKREVGSIMRVAGDAHKVCRLAKREVEKNGAAFWYDLSAWRKMMNH